MQMSENLQRNRDYFQCECVFPFISFKLNLNKFAALNINELFLFGICMKCLDTTYEHIMQKTRSPIST